jgi:hypothetical protein
MTLFGARATRPWSQTTGFQDFRISGFQDFRISGFQDFRISGKDLSKMEKCEHSKKYRVFFYERIMATKNSNK